MTFHSKFCHRVGISSYSPKEREKGNTKQYHTHRRGNIFSGMKKYVFSERGIKDFCWAPRSFEENDIYFFMHP